MKSTDYQIYRYEVINNELCAGFLNKDGKVEGSKRSINFGAALICYERDDHLLTKPILTGIASRKHWSPTHDSPGMYTNIFKIKNLIQQKLGNRKLI